MAGGGGAHVKFDALSIQAPAAALSTASPKGMTFQLTTKEQTAFSADIKFAPLRTVGIALPDDSREKL
jgi:ATP-dependent Lhr-like helicase